MRNRRNKEHLMPPFGRKIIEVAAGTEIRGRRGDKMVVSPARSLPRAPTCGWCQRMQLACVPVAIQKPRTFH